MSEIDSNNLDVIDSADKADELLSSIEAPSERILDREPPTATEPEWDLTVGGKQIKAKREQVMQCLCLP